jgi:hypothetical protein
MSEILLAALHLIDWTEVRMVSINERTIHVIVGKEPPRKFVFESEADAKGALHEWLNANTNTTIRSQIVREP